MPESIEGRTDTKLDKIRPVRVANRFVRCPFGNLVAQFYAEELGMDPQALSKQNLDALPPEERLSLASQLRDKFIVLMRSGNIYPEALYLSCTKLPPISQWDYPPRAMQRLDTPGFALMLGKYLPQTDCQTTKPPAVLSLACGSDFEASVIEYYFDSTRNQALHVGIDRDEEAIYEARQLYHENPNFHFIAGDLDNSSTQRQLEEFATQYDLLVMRHAPISPEGDLWRRVLQNYSQYLKRGGLLLITTYYQEEFETLQREGLPSCYQIMVSEKNRARVFNRRLYGMAIRETIGILMASVFSDKEPDLKFGDSLDNLMRRDQYLVLATKI